MTQAEIYSKRFAALMRLAAYYSHRATKAYHNRQDGIARAFYQKEQHCYQLATQNANAWYYSTPTQGNKS